jgi:YesN/AraC family two-component response regulator
MEGNEDFAYMYISFMGERGAEIVSSMGLSTVKPTVNGFAGEIGFWKSAIQRINPRNANLLTESVLLYTASFIDTDSGEVKSTGSTVVENLVAYIEQNYADTDLSLKKTAEIFAYTDKYLSRIFKLRMGKNFNEYLCEIRISRAIQMMDEGKKNVEWLAMECGYRDPVYFAKVFKRVTGKTPHEYIKSREDNKNTV